MSEVKLSELPDDVEVSVEDSNTRYTVAELKREILELGEAHHLISNWYTIKEATWTPNAETMIERLIEDASDEMYEDWWERANDCVDNEFIEIFQFLLNKMFANARGYWEYDKQVEIDIFPHKAGDPA